MRKIDNLFISDLDGTLLDNNASITNKTANLLNVAIEKGADFTVATARTLATAKQILSEVHLNYPLILMNGVLVYDLQKEKYLFSATLDKNIFYNIIDVLNKHHIEPFIYTIDDNKMNTYYKNLSTKAMLDFYEERYKKYYKSFTKIDNYSEIENHNIIYFTLINTYDILKPVYDDISKIDGIEITFYDDHYTDDLWYMEIFSKTASKKKAVEFLGNILKPKNVTCFGDNTNDIPMFEIADYSVAVANANSLVKEKANEIIGANVDNAVAQFVYEKTMGKGRS